MPSHESSGMASHHIHPEQMCPSHRAAVVSAPHASMLNILFYELLHLYFVYTALSHLLCPRAALAPSVWP